MFPASTSPTEAPRAKPDSTPAGVADDAMDAGVQSQLVVQAAAESSGAAASTSAPVASSQLAKSVAPRRKSAPAATARPAQAVKKAVSRSSSSAPAAAAVLTPPASEQTKTPEAAPKGKKRRKKSVIPDKVAVPAHMVRDSFTMPEADFALLSQMKRRAIAAQRETKKSELLRAGLQVLAQLNDADLLVALNALTPVKAGRPKKR